MKTGRWLDSVRSSTVSPGSPSAPGAASEAESGARNDLARDRRRESLLRLQVGLTGLGLMVLLAAVADIVEERAQQAEQVAVPEATIPPEPEAAGAAAAGPGALDPLVGAGLVPDLPAVQSREDPGPVLPEQGEDRAVSEPQPQSKPPGRSRPR